MTDVKESTLDRTTDLRPGDRLDGYVVTRTEPLEHLDGTFLELKHERTGARHIHIATRDDNNVFVVLLPTPPKDSTGVPHILEHVALSGSERFPVKDVFFAMNPRSLRTFMNASTSPDATQYHFSTRNPKDFFNLLSVYLDAVFFPRLAELSFRQEGHRLEFEHPTDPSSGLRFKGVVFNEMKGSMANPVSILFRAAGKSLFPGLAYAHNSGGDPKEIPTLTWEGLREFHSKHYHPSNAYFYTYGNLPLPEILETIERQVLDRFEPAQVDVHIPDQRRFEEPVQLSQPYPLAEHEDPTAKCQVLVVWLVVPTSDSFHVLAFEVLERVLLANAASPLRKALVDSGLGSALNDLSGYLAFAKESVFGAGLKDVREEDVAKVESLILDTLARIVAEGVDQQQVDGAIHRLEIERREVSNSGLPYGLKLFERLEPAYIHGGDPYRALQFDEDLRRLQQERLSGPFFENLIKRWLIDNPHRSRVVLVPDPDMEERETREELAKLAQIELGLREEDKSVIVKEAVVLQQMQDANEDLSVLPTLELTDIPMKFEDIPHSIEEVGGANVGFFPQPTNGISYLDLSFDFSRLDDRLINLMGVFGFALTRSSAGPYDYLEMAARIENFTGGVGASSSIRIPVTGRGDFAQNFTLSGKALARNHYEFVEILKDIITGVRFEPRRLKDLIGQQKGSLEPRILQAGHHYAQKLAVAQLESFAQIDERVSGLSLVSTLKRLSVCSEGELEEVISDLDSIRDNLFKVGASPRVCVTAEEASLPVLRGLVEETLGGLDPMPILPPPPDRGFVRGRHQARTTSAPVSYNARVHEVVGFTHPDAPALLVLANYLDDKYLLREIREKGGAYGAAAIFGRESGIFSFLSYRDPHIVRTHRVWDAAVPTIVEASIDPDDLKEAILSACAAVDPLLSPDTKGRSRFFDDLAGYTLERKAEFKQGLLNVGVDDLKRVASEHLAASEPSFATIGNPEMVEAANKELGEIFEVTPI
ncbi:MAG: insulinase family protein [Actinomycetota bacterium]|nr:insulinase family protein [Actinomycetota bacterium]